MEDYHLGYTTRGQGLTIGTQHIIYKHSVKYPVTEGREDAAPEKVIDDAKAPEGDDGSQGQVAGDKVQPADGPNKDDHDEQGHSKKRASAGGETATAHPEDADDAPEERHEAKRVRAELEPGPAKQDDEQGREDGAVRDEDGAAGTGSGPHETDREGSATGGDGHEAAAHADEK